MARDLHHEKDKLDLAKSNPRNFGLSSGDYQYRNYMTNIKPRVKKSENDNDNTNERTRTASNNNFRRLSASIKVSEESPDNTEKKAKALYAHMSSVPHKKTSDCYFDKGDKTIDNSNRLDKSENVEKESTLSVNKLRTLFDNSNDDINNDSNISKRRNNLKSYEQYQRPRKESKNENDRSTDYKTCDITTKKTLNIEDMVSSDDSTAKFDYRNKQEENPATESIPLCKTKGMHGLLQRKPSEFDDFDDRVVPTGVMKIDINSILAPETPDNDNASNHEEVETPVNVSSPPSDFDLSKHVELNRLKQVQQDLKTSDVFNIKRRSLKDKLSAMASMSQDSFDNSIVPYETINQTSEQVSNTEDTSDNDSDSDVAEMSYSLENDGEDTNCSEINDNVLPDIIDSIKMTTDDESVHNISRNQTVDCEKNSYDLCNNNILGYQSELEAIPFNNIDKVKAVDDDSGRVDNSVTDIDLSVNQSAQIEKSEVTDDKLKHDIAPLFSEHIENDTDGNLKDAYGSVLARFDAFITNHGLSDVDLSAPISDTVMDADILTNILDDKIQNEEFIDSGSKWNENVGDSEMDLMNEILGQLGNNDVLQSKEDNFVGNISEQSGLSQDAHPETTTTEKDVDVKPPSLIIPKVTKQKKVDVVSPKNTVDTVPAFEVIVGKDNTNTVEHKVVPRNIVEDKDILETADVSKSISEDERNPIYEIIDKTITEAERLQENEVNLPDIVEDEAPIERVNQNHVDSALSLLHSKYNPSFDLPSSDGYNNNEHLLENNLKAAEEIPVLHQPEALLTPKKSSIWMGKGSRKQVNFRNDVHDVVYTYGPLEYDRANADIDPIASSAEWELEKRVDKMDMFTVDLQKDERGLGLSIIGLGVGTETGVEKLGIFVKTLTENGASEKDGRIQVNDQILEVNGISLVGVTQYFAAQTLKNTDGIVRFLMGREKTRKSQYSPGSMEAGNHKHVEEINKILQQLETFEDRAINAENTLEDVKVELLKAEEHGHDVERQLKDSKEQLSAATESPFIGSTRKLKNEIKKKGKGDKHEKMDDLQRSLKDAMNELNLSKESVLELKTLNTSKDDEISSLQQMMDGLNKEKDNLVHKEVEMKVKAEASEHVCTQFPLLEQENKYLKDEILVLNGKLEINGHLLTKMKDAEVQEEKIKVLEQKLNEHVEELENARKVKIDLVANVSELEEKNEYLQSLILKLERREDGSREIIDFESKFKEKEEEYIKENGMLRKRILELEQKLHPSKVMISQSTSISDEFVTDLLNGNTKMDLGENNDFPVLPTRGYVNANAFNGIFSTIPPEISRGMKPGTNEEDIHLEFTVGKAGDDQIHVCNDSGIESINNIDEVGVVEDEINLTNSNITIDANPVPKPSRGNYICAVNEDPGILKKQLFKCPEDHGIVDKTITEKVDKNILGAGTGDLVITHETNIPVVIVDNKFSSKLNVDLPGGKIDNDSEEDEGQFQIIQEDIQEELSTPAATMNRGRMHSDITNDRNSGTPDELDDSMIGVESRDEWFRLDSTAREAQAEIIADQVTSQSRIIRKFSNTSSSPSEDESEAVKPNEDVVDDVKPARAHSVKIDAMYFEHSPKSDSIDHEVMSDSLFDTPVIDIEEPDFTGAIQKSLSFDLAIPPTTVQILENKAALDKRAAVMKTNNRRHKPTRAGRIGASEGGTIREADDTEKRSPSPRRTKAIGKLQAAQSVPNLSYNDKPSKRKHMFVFHLPKAFKKSKIGKRLSHHSSFDKGKDRGQSMSDTDLSISPVHDDSLGGHTEVQPNSPSLNTELAVVPIEEKTEALKTEKANDAATEEAVVPFADKEMLMEQEISMDVHIDESVDVQSSPDSSINSAQEINQHKITVTIPPITEDEPEVQIQIANLTEVDLRASPSQTPTEIEFSSFTMPPVEIDTPVTYSERGIDVAMINGHSEGDADFKSRLVTEWDVRQVGLWLTEIKMSDYVSGFKQHQVDGQTLLCSNGKELKDYGVQNQEHRAEIKKHIKEFRTKYGKGGSLKLKDHKSKKEKLQFWKGKYKLN